MTEVKKVARKINDILTKNQIKTRRIFLIVLNKTYLKPFLTLLLILSRFFFKIFSLKKTTLYRKHYMMITNYAHLFFCIIFSQFYNISFNLLDQAI